MMWYQESDIKLIVSSGGFTLELEHSIRQSTNNFYRGTWGMLKHICTVEKIHGHTYRYL